MADNLFLSSPHMSSEGYEMAYIKEAFSNNWIAPLGENINQFEKELARRVGRSSALALSSGTSAIHLALKCAGVEQGDIVFCPTLTFCATANPIIYQGAKPVFIDSEEESWNMSPSALKKAFQKYPSVKAVIVVHLYGLSAQMDKIMSICKEYDVAVIEDAAESLGTQYKGEYTGAIADYGVYSFNGNKMITTSGGGMLVSNHTDMIEKARFWASQSKDKASHYQHSELGFNYRMSNISAGIGRGQLRVLNERIAKKQYIFKFYRRKLEACTGISFMPDNKWDMPNRWLSVIGISGDIHPLQLIKTLERYNIESRRIWKPLHLQPFFKDCDVIGGDVAEGIFEHGVCLPSDTKMSYNDLMRVTSAVKSVIGLTQL